MEVPTSSQRQVQPSPKTHALLLDGGGVRGLCSLLILERFMRILNDTPRIQRRGDTLAPHDIFDLIAGTSTGGLIAIMLGKLGMTVRQCIDAYQALSGDIFGKKTLRGRISLGLWKARYRGHKFRDSVITLLEHANLNADLAMIRGQDDPPDIVNCAVVCNEHKSKSKFSGLKSDAMRFCSTECHEQRDLNCRVSDAAQATAAAMTYFDIVPVGSRWFSDGGIKYNNPSETILEHYTRERRVQDTVNNYRRLSTVSSVTLQRHAGLNFDRVTMLNIGTGSKTDQTPIPHRHWLKNFITPKIFTNARGLGSTLLQAATASENVANTMRLFERLNPGISYERLSPTNEVCWIKLDRHDRLQEIERYTNDWLQDPAVTTQMERIARDIVEEKFGLPEQARIDVKRVPSDLCWLNQLRQCGDGGRRIRPGGIFTGLQAGSDGAAIAERLRNDPDLRRAGKNVQQGAATQVWAAIAPVWADRGGLYLEDMRVSRESENPSLLWGGHMNFIYDERSEAEL